MKKKTFVIVHNVRSAYNVGSIFRTSDGAGVDKIFLSGYTAGPSVSMYSSKAHKMISKTALGAEKKVEWEKSSNITKLINKLKKEGFSIVSLEESKKSKNLKKFKPKFPLALIVGNEIRGIDKGILEKSDSIVEISMKGTKRSLNVSVAFGIAIYDILNKNND